MHHLRPFFEIFLWEVPGTPPPSCEGIFPHAPTPPRRSKIGLQPAVHLVSGSVTDNVMYIFNAILLKIQLSLSEFKRLYLHPRLHHFASFFQNFLGGDPPNPHQREGPPLPYPPQVSGLEKTPQVDFWIRHCLRSFKVYRATFNSVYFQIYM